MGDPFILDAARGTHIIGLAIGFGLAICADVLAARSLFTPVSAREAALMHVIHRAILFGLLLLWVSGLALLHIRTGWDPAAVTPKLIVKLGVVVLLSANAALIGLYALPQYAAHVGHRFGEFDQSVRVRLAAIAGVSLSCWASALALGIFSQLKPMGFESLFAVFVPIFLVGLVGAFLLASVSGLAVRIRGSSRSLDDAPWSEEAGLPKITTPLLQS